jgi:hypothetical protein
LISLEIAEEYLNRLHIDYATNGFNNAKESQIDEYDFDSYSGDYDGFDVTSFTPEYRLMFDELWDFFKQQENSEQYLNDLECIESIEPDIITNRVNNAFKYLKQHLNKLEAESFQFETGADILSKN